MNKYLFIFLLLFSGGTLAKQHCVDVEPIYKKEAGYPLIESSVPHEGFVVVEFGISYDGTVFWSKVIESSSVPTSRFKVPFEKSAIQAINAWKFQTRSISCNTEMKFTFKQSV